jgi:peptide/nickel transport system permease protein
MTGTMTVTGRPAGLVRRAVSTPQGMVGLALVVLVTLVALAGPALAPHDPTDLVAPPNELPGPGLPFGTDKIGRDVLSRFLSGGAALLALAALATALGIALGAALGLLAGYAGGWLDEVLMRANDVALALPQLVVALLCVSVLGPRPWLLVAVIGATHAPRTARVLRSATAEVAGRDFVRAARATGVSRGRVLGAEILPNVTGPLAVELGLRFTYSIGFIASLSFLGLGVQPPTADWGLMINENRDVFSYQPWGVLLPVTAVAVLTVGTNLLADAFARAGASR